MAEIWAYTFALLALILIIYAEYKRIKIVEIKPLDLTALTGFKLKGIHLNNQDAEKMLAEYRLLSGLPVEEFAPRLDQWKLDLAKYYEKKPLDYQVVGNVVKVNFH